MMSLVALLTVGLFLTPSVSATCGYSYTYNTKQCNSPYSPGDENAAPSMSGLNTRDAHRVTFLNAEDVVFVMSNTEIFVQNGKAFDRHVYVFMDGKVIDVIDVGVHPNQVGQKWLGIGGQRASIPFDVYYEILPDGRLVDNGAGYQHVFTDLNGERYIEED